MKRRGFKGRRKTFPRRGRLVNKTKQLVTGHGPTLLEKIGSGVGTVATLAKAIIPVISAINTEEKFFDTNSNTSTITLAVPFFQDLSTMATGVLESQRIGNSILAKSININLLLQNNYTINPNVFFRVVLFSDKAQAGTAPTLAQLMQTTAVTWSMKNKNFTDRFVILKDHFYTYSPMYDPTLSGGNQGSHMIKIFKKLDFHIRYVGPSGTIPDAGNNTLYLMVWSNAASNNGQTCAIAARLSYTDN